MSQFDFTKQRLTSLRTFPTGVNPQSFSFQSREAPKSTTSLPSATATKTISIPKESLEEYDIFADSAQNVLSTSSTVSNTPHNPTYGDTYSVERSVTSPGGRVVKLLSPIQQNTTPNLNVFAKKKIELSSNTQLSPSQLDPHFENEITSETQTSSNKNWITVFGFPHHKLSFVLKHFATYGEIIDKRTGNGNWIHILFRESFAAKKALSKSGKKFDSDLMLGVVECLDPTVVNSGNNKKRKFEENEGGDAFAPKATTMSSQWVQAENGVKKRALNATELTSPPANIYANYNDNNRPQPQRGFWSKLADMVFKF